MKLISLVKRTVLGAAVGILLKDLWDWLVPEPNHLKNSRTKALDDLLYRDGYRPNPPKGYWPGRQL